MRENNLVIKSVRKASSPSRFAVRATESGRLHDGVEDFLFRTQADTSRLAGKLLNKEFLLARYTDPTYPA